MWVDASVKTSTSRRRRSRHPTQPGDATVYTNAPERRREPIFANLCTLLRPPRPLAPSDAIGRRNSVHKCPRTASRGHFLRSVYTPAPPTVRSRHPTQPGVATVYTNAPELRREPIFANLCTLLRPHRPLARPGGATGSTASTAPWPRDASALGPEAHAAGAVTQPPTRTHEASYIVHRMRHSGSVVMQRRRGQRLTMGQRRCPASRQARGQRQP